MCIEDSDAMFDVPEDDADCFEDVVTVMSDVSDVSDACTDVLAVSDTCVALASVDCAVC